MKKWTKWQKFMMLGGVATAGVAFSIMSNASTIGFSDADEILKLAKKIGGKETIEILRNSLSSNIIEFPKGRIAS